MVVLYLVLEPFATHAEAGANAPGRLCLVMLGKTLAAVTSDRELQFVPPLLRTIAGECGVGSVSLA